MHFITGGAFNGKRAWVEKHYPNAKWISAYHDQPLRKHTDVEQNAIIVFEGLELWVKILLQHHTARQAQEFLKETLDDWLEWEKAHSSRKVIVIGTDITKGVVPIEKEKRDWRDVTGRVYQEAVAKSEKVDVIWYGLNQTMKDERKIK